MTREQEKELLKHHAKINDRGESLVKGTIIWVINEALENIRKIEDLLGPEHDRPSKKLLNPIIRDLRDQLKEIKIRID